MIALPSKENNTSAPIQSSIVKDKKCGQVTNVYVQEGENGMVGPQGEKGEVGPPGMYVCVIHILLAGRFSL